MGSLQNGLFGGFNGRVGNLVGYILNGKNVIRTIGHSGKPLSPARKINCDRMKIVNDFLHPITSFIKLGFKLKVLGTDRNYYNEAVSYNKKHAVMGEYPNAEMDYSKAMLSMGTLLKAENPQIQLIGTAIEFTWDVPDDLPWENRKDRAMLQICFPGNTQQTHCLSASHREDGKHTLQIDPSLVNARIEAYISFIKADGSAISDSVHAGSIAKKEKIAEPEIEKTEPTEKAEKNASKEVQTIVKHTANTKSSPKTKIKAKLSTKLKPQFSPVRNAKIPENPDHPS
ncbi:DUF6266 family protein [Pedobacter gandavensis]|uniref:DUF6266 family protein n=1 Tax=Pedobacter gandavensis TaxID=2679963 RepID=UPI00292E6244|nr:DUF6266 family protein [Pedobacter gandavensis]